MDLATLISQRQKLADEHDAARAQWPHDHPEFIRVVSSVVRGLEELLAPIMSSQDIIEIARTKMWLGDAMFDLAQSRNASFEPALAAYRSAETLVQIANDPLFQAKFDANYANILLRANPGSEEVRGVIARYERALPVLERHNATFASMITKELARARRLLSQLEELSMKLNDQLSELRTWLAQIAKGDPSADVFASLTGLLRELEDAYSDAVRTGDVASTLNLVERIRGVYQRWMQDIAPVVSGPRGRLVATVMKLWGELTGVSFTPQVDKFTRDRGLDIASDVVLASGALRNNAEASVADVCRRSLWAPAGEARRLFSRALVTWAEPIWPVGSGPELAQAIYVTDSRHRQRVAERARALGLELLEAPLGRDVAEARFDAIRRAAVVIADIAEDNAGRAAACYEIGVALTLGRPLLVLAPAGRPIPFDIEVQPVPYPTGEDGWVSFDDALERALLLPQRAPDQGSLTPLLTAARRHFADRPASVDELERSIDVPLQAAGVLANIVRERVALTGQPHVVINAPWARRYPEKGARRLFHVMPFGATWSDTLKQRTALACKNAGVTYRRGDDVEDARVIRSIWDELCLASHVLVDLTAFNPNVCLELGMAHVLGKGVLVVGQSGTKETLFATLKNVRVADYALGGERYPAMVTAFLDGIGHTA